MAKLLYSCTIVSQDGSEHIVRRLDLFIFIWQFGLKHHYVRFHTINHSNEVDLYVSNKVHIIMNLCKIIEVAFICYVAFPLVLKLALILPPYRESDLVATTLFICGIFSGYVVKVLIASFLVPHVRWLTLKPDMDPADFQFKIDQSKHAGMWIVYPVLAIEIFIFFIVFF